MNQQQKNHARRRIRELLDDQLEKLSKEQSRSERKLRDKLKISQLIVDKKLKLPTTVGGMKQILLNLVRDKNWNDSSVWAPSSMSLIGLMFGLLTEQSIQAYAEGLEKNLEDHYNDLERQLNEVTEAAVDQIMFAGDTEALEIIAGLRKELERLSAIKPPKL